jgi:hypothetical protein
MRDYLRSEVLDRLPEVDALFLTRTSALERMSGPLCDAVLGLQGSATTLAGLAQSSLLVVPLDRRDSGTAITTCSATCSWQSWTAWSPAWSRPCGGGRPSGMRATGAPMRQWSTGCRRATPIRWPGLRPC